MSGSWSDRSNSWIYLGMKQADAMSIFIVSSSSGRGWLGHAASALCLVVIFLWSCASHQPASCKGRPLSRHEVIEIVQKGN